MILLEKIQKFIRNEGFKKYFLNSSWLVGEKILRLISGLFVSIYVARYLGPENYGILNYVISFVALFSVIAPLGLDEIVINELIKRPENRDLILGTSFKLKFIGVLTTIFLISLTFFFDLNDKKTNIFIFIVVLNLLFQPIYVIDLYFQSQVKARYLVQANILSLVINSLLRLSLVFLNASLIYFVLVSILDSLIIALGLIYFYSKNELKIFKWESRNFIAIEMLKQSWPLIFSGIAIIIYMRIDQIMIKEMLDFKAVGNFSAAVRLTELWYFIPVAIGSSFFPALVNSKKLSEVKFRNRLGKLMSFMVLIAILISIPTSFMARFIIINLYGLDFTNAAPVLIVYIWATVFVFLGVISGKWFIIENLNRISLYRSIFGAMANIGLNFVMIPKFGILGAAYSTVICQIIQTYLSNLIFKSTRGLFVLQTRSLFLIDFVKIVFHKKNIY
jgi:O-antigen/teichoic acid export membrane protein